MLYHCSFSLHSPQCLNDIQHVFINPAVDTSSLEKCHIQTSDHLFGYLGFSFSTE